MSPSISINSPTTIIGNLFCEEPVKIWHRNTLQNCSIGAFTSISPNCSLFEIKIGRYCSIGNNVQILSSHPMNGLTTAVHLYERTFSGKFDHPIKYSHTNFLETIIGNDVWIGSGVYIKAGVKVGNGSIIGAGSVVTSDVAPYSVVGGVPAKIIKRRFSDDHIAMIENIEWWKYNISEPNIDWSDLQNSIKSILDLIDSKSISPYIGKRYKLWNNSENQFKYSLI